jgi:signal transduction histidine kinase
VLRELRSTSTGLQELARDEATARPTGTRLLALDDGLRGTIRSLRAQLLQIYPPAVDAPRLEDALADLVAPAAASGIDTDVRVSGAEAAPQAHVTLVWRAAQEAVRNAVEHARCRRIEVEVTGDGRYLTLRVADDGVGFVPGARSGEGTLGLRALRDMVQEAGGSMDVQSGPGRGTTLRMRLGAGS